MQFSGNDVVSQECGDYFFVQCIIGKNKFRSGKNKTVITIN